MQSNPSSPGSPESNHAAACSRRSESIGSRSYATPTKAKEAKRGESGHPQLTPSFMRSVCHVPSSPFMVDSVCLIVEEFSEGEEFGKGGAILRKR